MNTGVWFLCSVYREKNDASFQHSKIIYEEFAYTYFLWRIDFVANQQEPLECDTEKIHRLVNSLMIYC